MTRLIALAVATLVLTSCEVATDSHKPTPAPTSTPTSESASPMPHTLDLTGLRTGDQPRIAWSRGTLLNGDRAKQVLPPRLDQFAETKQLLVMRDTDGNVYAYSPDGPTSKTPIGKATGALAVNAERNLVAWIAPGGSPTVLQEGEARPAVLEKQPGVTGGDAVAVLGHDCFNGPETVEDAGCSVYFRAQGTEARSFVASNHGFVEELRKGTFQLQDADESGVVGWTTLTDDQRTCSTYTGGETLDADTTKTWKTCDFMPLAFSPDGQHVLATSSHGYEGLGASSLTILNRATGKPGTTLRNDTKSQAAIVDMQWEDPSHVLAVVFQQGKWAILRVSADGLTELAAKPIPGDETDIKYRLAVQP